MILNDTVRQALTAGHLAHLVTLNNDGSPHVSIVWVGLDGDEIVSGHLKLHKKLKNIQRHAGVALSMVTGGRAYMQPLKCNKNSTLAVCLLLSYVLHFFYLG
jgi:hypothetical protein